MLWSDFQFENKGYQGSEYRKYFVNLEVRFYEKTKTTKKEQRRRLGHCHA